MLTRASKEAKELINVIVLGSAPHQVEASSHVAILDRPIRGRCTFGFGPRGKLNGRNVVSSELYCASEGGGTAGASDNHDFFSSDSAFAYNKPIRLERCKKPLLAPGIFGAP